MVTYGEWVKKHVENLRRNPDLENCELVVQPEGSLASSIVGYFVSTAEVDTDDGPYYLKPDAEDLDGTTTLTDENRIVVIEAEPTENIPDDE